MLEAHLALTSTQMCLFAISKAPSACYSTLFGSVRPDCAAANSISSIN
jgi:hypothetical protein